jgi:hypothetical protein
VGVCDGEGMKVGEETAVFTIVAVDVSMGGLDGGKVWIAVPAGVCEGGAASSEGRRQAASMMKRQVITNQGCVFM